MPVARLEITADQDNVSQPIIWRLGRLFNVVTNIHRARVTNDFGYVSLDIEGTKADIERASGYLRWLGALQDGGEAEPPPAGEEQPEMDIPLANAIYVRLSAVFAGQGSHPLLYRVGKDFSVVANIERAAFDEEEGGYIEVSLSGPLAEVQRSIAYLHTTGIHVNPRQRSVTDYSNL